MPLESEGMPLAKGTRYASTGPSGYAIYSSQALLLKESRESPLASVPIRTYTVETEPSTGEGARHIVKKRRDREPN